MNDCWNWVGSLTDKGYGRIKIDGKWKRAHRVIYLNFVGTIPHGMGVLHKCDNPACVNPEHLFLGTQKDNMQDCARKLRIHGQKKYPAYVRKSGPCPLCGHRKVLGSDDGPTSIRTGAEGTHPFRGELCHQT